MGRINWHQVFRYGRWLVPPAFATVPATTFAEKHQEDTVATDRDKNTGVVNITNITNIMNINKTSIYKAEITQNLLQGGPQDSKTPQGHSPDIGLKSSDE